MSDYSFSFTPACPFISSTPPIPTCLSLPSPFHTFSILISPSGPACHCGRPRLISLHFSFQPHHSPPPTFQGPACHCGRSRLALLLFLPIDIPCFLLLLSVQGPACYCGRPRLSSPLPLSLFFSLSPERLVLIEVWHSHLICGLPFHFLGAFQAVGTHALIVVTLRMLQLYGFLGTMRSLCRLH